MTKLRVIFTPDDGYESFPKFKIVEGKDEVDALINLAEFYDFEIDREELEEGNPLENLIDFLSGEELNLSFVQNVDTGKVYFDVAFN